jgi:glutamine cyclotransferase
LNEKDYGVNHKLKKRFLPILIFIMVITSGIFLLFANNLMPNQLNTSADQGIEMDTLALGDTVDNISLSIEPLGIVYIDGYLWVCERDGDLYKLDPNTGSEMLHYNLPFDPAGICFDGTYFYISVDQTPNGSILKYTYDGIYVDRFDVPVSTNFVAGLTFDGINLWATKDETPNSLYQIDPITGVVQNTVSVSSRYGGMMWLDNRLWAVQWQSNEVHILDPNTAKVQEVIDMDDTDLGKYGITHNGTHYFTSEWQNPEIRIIKIPTQPGEVWNDRSAPDTHPLGISYNGSHYFLLDTILNKVDILDSGTLENESSFYLPFNPLGVAVVNDYLYISSSDANNVYKYTHSGSLIATFSTDRRYYALEYDGLRLLASDYLGSYIRQLDLSDCTVIKNFSVPSDYAGICFDSVNNVFWTINWTNNKILQLNPIDFSITGIEYDTPASNGNYGIEFNGEHLVTTSHVSDTIYKVIIYLNSPPLSNHPVNLTILQNSYESIGWILTDDLGSGYYRVFINNIPSDWFEWTNNSNLNFPIITSSAGIFNYTIQFNDSAGTFGIPDTVMVEITPTNEIPGFTAYMLVFTLLSLIGMVIFLKRDRIF